MRNAQTKPLRDRALVLAVDLDGTFLGGSVSDRRELYDLIGHNRHDIALLYVTGRDIDFAVGVAGGEAPAPDFIIGDVGTSVVVGPNWTPHAATEAWIDECWPGPDRATEILARRPNLARQRVFGGRRVSYFFADANEAEAARVDVESAGYAGLLSANVFFDVLPPGVNKGHTLLRLMEHEGLKNERALCAGDTMNDLALFQTGLRGVAVGNAEPPLRAAITKLDNVYSAKREGAGGIVEAILHFKLLPSVVVEAI